MADRELALDTHRRLIAHYDVERWHWRDDTPPLDIAVGAILVQHTAWSNVELALANLRQLPELTVDSLLALSEDNLALLVRPAGTPLTKARRLQAFAGVVQRHGGFEAFFAIETAQLRQELLATPGIGPETADVILLYGARRPVVVHDAYTARLYRRLGTGPEANRYEDWRVWLDTTLPGELKYRMRDHAAIVIHCKETCRVRPKCAQCPLLEICQEGQRLTLASEASEMEAAFTPSPALRAPSL